MCLHVDRFSRFSDDITTPQSLSCLSLGVFTMRHRRCQPRLAQTRDGIASTTLDLEPRRLIFTSLSSYFLDLDLSRSDIEIQKSLGARAGSEKSVQHALTLKRERELDVDGARAEWRIAEGQLVIYA